MEKQIGDLAEAIAKTGPDPVILSAMILIVATMLGLFVWLIKSYTHQQEKTLVNYQEQLLERAAVFERSLNTVVSSNNENMGKVTAQLQHVAETYEKFDNRMITVEAYIGFHRSITAPVQPLQPLSAVTVNVSPTSTGGDPV